MIPGYDPERDSAGFHFDAASAERVCAFFETQLCFIEGRTAGAPFRLMPWQAATIGLIFGWMDATGARRFREVFLYIPRKAGKSPLAAGILDYVLFCDGEPGAQIYCAAADRDQASIVFRHARGMIEHNGELAKRVEIFNSSKTIKFGDCFARVISAEAASKHGYNSHLVLVDELHAQPDRELVDVLTTSTSSRRQPLIVYITTADYDRPSICNEKYEYACKVRDGILPDPRFLPIIYEAGPDDNWESEAVWRKANPSLGVTKSLEYMARECEKAKNEPTYQATFRRLELNQRTDVEQIWLDMAKWDACGTEPLPSDEVLRLVPCWGGLDLSTTTDLTALALCWLLPDGVAAVRLWHWIPEENARLKEKRDRVPYLSWHDRGFVEMTPGNVIDYAYIRARILELSKKFTIRDVAFDPWNASQITTELAEQDGVKMVEFRQGFVTMSPAAKEFERRVSAGTLAHGGNPLLRWQASHAVVRSDPAGNIKPDKSKAVRRIDGIVASVMALARATVQTAAGGGASVYEKHGIRTTAPDQEPPEPAGGAAASPQKKPEPAPQPTPEPPASRDTLTERQRAFDQGD